MYIGAWGACLSWCDYELLSLMVLTHQGSSSCCVPPCRFLYRSTASYSSGNVDRNRPVGVTCQHFILEMTQVRVMSLPSTLRSTPYCLAVTDSLGHDSLIKVLDLSNVFMNFFRGKSTMSQNICLLCALNTCIYSNHLCLFPSCLNLCSQWYELALFVVMLTSLPPRFSPENMQQKKIEFRH